MKYGTAPLFKMRLLLTVTLLLLALGQHTTLARKSYAGWQMLRTAPLAREDVEPVSLLMRDSRFLFWRAPRVSQPLLALAPPEHVRELRERLFEMNLQPVVHIPDVQTVFDKEREEIESIRSRELLGGRNVTFDRYMDLDEIEAYIDLVAATYPSLVSVEQIGSSYEGRPLRVLHISSGGAPGSKAGVFIDGGIHAAEWLGHAAGLYVVDQLTAFSALNQEMLDLAHWHILLVANPDGYVFSWSDDRVWRKTRHPNNASTCTGVDPNRNFDVHWGEGGETDPCLWNYPGPSVWSEVESKAMADFIRPRGQAGELQLYMALHTYGPSLLHPYGYNFDPVPPSVTVPAEEAVAALEAVRGTQYDVGSIAELFFLAFGSSQDYAYDVAGIPLAYTWEFLPGGDTGMDPPPAEIRPAVAEAWEGIKVLVRHAAALKNSQT